MLFDLLLICVYLVLSSHIILGTYSSYLKFLTTEISLIAVLASQWSHLVYLLTVCDPYTKELKLISILDNPKKTKSLCLQRLQTHRQWNMNSDIPSMGCLTKQVEGGQARHALQDPPVSDCHSCRKVHTPGQAPLQKSTQPNIITGFIQ